MKITLREFFDSKEKLAIHCDTLEKAKTLLSAFDRMGKFWCNKMTYLGDWKWDKYNKDTCYTNNGQFCYRAFYENKDNGDDCATIIEFEDVILPEIVKVKEPKPFKVFPLSYEIHDYALENLVGKEHAMSATDLANRFNISERQLRSIRVNHNNPKANFQHLLLTCQDGYFIAGSTSPEDTKKQYSDTAYRLIHHAVSELKEAKRLLKQIELDGTTRLKLTPYMKELVEISVDLSNEE